MTTSRREWLLALLSSTAFAAKPHAEIAFAGGKVYPSPHVPPIAQGVVILRDGRISAVGPVTRTKIPPRALVVDCRGRAVVAGFTNSHVHFTESHWTPAATLSVSALSDQLQTMLTRWGFTSALDTGSKEQNSRALVRRIESGEIAGPAIRRAGGGFVKKGGVPDDRKDAMEFSELLNPEQAAAAVHEVLEKGADAIKIYANSTGVPGPPLSLEIIKAVTAEAHRASKPVISHAHDLEGIWNSVRGEVDILAHTVPFSGVWGPDLLREMVDRRVALTPTLHLCEYQARQFDATADETAKYVGLAREQLRAFTVAGGEVLFGTDAGYMTDYDPTREYVLMGEAGLSPMYILACLTTHPSARFGDSKTRGQLAPGFFGDVTVLDADPVEDVRNFAKVRLCIRHGKVLFKAG